MTPKDAIAIVQRFAGVLADCARDSGPAYAESLLPFPRETIIRAMKLWLAYEHQNGTLADPFYNEIATAAARLPHFMEDARARWVALAVAESGATLKHAARGEKLNPAQVQAIHDAKEAHEQLLGAALAGSELRRELSDFLAQVQRLDRKGPGYWEQACAVAGTSS